MPRVNDAYTADRRILFAGTTMAQLARETGIDYRTLQNYRKRPWTAKWENVKAILAAQLRSGRITPEDCNQLITR